MKNTQIKSLIPFHIILQECEIELQGITYENIHRFGDVNIKALIAKIERAINKASQFAAVVPFDNERASTAAMREEKKAYKIHNTTLRRAHYAFLKTYTKHRKAVIRFLESQLTGAYLPLFPVLRSLSEAAYTKCTHFAVFMYDLYKFYEKDAVPKTVQWKSAMYMGGTRQKYFCLLESDNTSEATRHKAHGYWWQDDYNSPLIMLQKDLAILRKHIAEGKTEFVELWLKNAGNVFNLEPYEIKAIIAGSEDKTLSQQQYLHEKKKVITKIEELSREEGIPNYFTHYLKYYSKKRLPPRKAFMKP